MNTDTDDDSSLNLDIEEISRSYRDALDGAVSWIVRSIEHGKGGSCAYYGAWGCWSRPYPETTGYIIPTLITYSDYVCDVNYANIAKGLGHWLLSIQAKEGFWNGGVHPPKKVNPSIFNTGQILLGLIALHHRFPHETEWLEAASRGSIWLAKGVNSSGVWADGNYKEGFSPSYYTRVAWPMLEVWSVSREQIVRGAAERVLRQIAGLCQDNGIIQGWGFNQDTPAFTHTIAYTIRGFIESSRILGETNTEDPVYIGALDSLYMKSELSRGALPGAFDDSWKASGSFTCLTGNAQVAICFLKHHQIKPDLRLLNAATKLLDYVCSKQRLKHPINGVRGAISGSSPLYGPYLRMRYPNWAAKFFADALMLCSRALEEELR